MSSTYRLLCLSHDPAICAGPEFGSNSAEDELNRAAETPHADCDLLIGRWSGALVEIGCPPRHASTMHNRIEWVDVRWLRLLTGAIHSADTRLLALAEPCMRTCWTTQRLHRLRELLGACST